MPGLNSLPVAGPRVSLRVQTNYCLSQLSPHCPVHGSSEPASKPRQLLERGPLHPTNHTAQDVLKAFVALGSLLEEVQSSTLVCTYNWGTDLPEGSR